MVLIFQTHPQFSCERLASFPPPDLASPLSVPKAAAATTILVLRGVATWPRSLPCPSPRRAFRNRKTNYCPYLQPSSIPTPQPSFPSSPNSPFPRSKPILILPPPPKT